MSHNLATYLFSSQEQLNLLLKQQPGTAYVKLYDREGRKIFAVDPKNPFCEVEMSRIAPWAFIMTDYFSGFGRQSATIWKDGVKSVYAEGEDEQEYMYHNYGAINTALKEMGVQKKGDDDEFDAIGLVKYRQCEDLFPNPACLDKEASLKNPSILDVFTKPVVRVDGKVILLDEDFDPVKPMEDPDKRREW